MKRGKVEKTAKENAYDEDKRSFGRKCASVLRTRGLKPLEYQLEYLRDNDVRIYEGIGKQDAIDIIESKIYDFKQLSSMME